MEVDEVLLPVCREGVVGYRVEVVVVEIPGGNMDTYYKPGTWNAVCWMCGRKRKADEMVRNWQGYYTCPKHNEPRHPQDFVRGVTEHPEPPWTQAQPEPVWIPGQGPGDGSSE